MTLSADAQKLLDRVTSSDKLGDIRSLAKPVKKDHAIALELWSVPILFSRLLSILIMDGKLLDRNLVEKLFADIEQHDPEEQIQLADWLLANQLSKNKSTTEQLLEWENSPSNLQRRLFWYHQGRLRWVGQTPPENSAELLTLIEKKLLQQPPEVQWAMNFTAAWIGIFDKSKRERCISIGENTGLYKGEKVHKGCTPNYLPEFISLEVRKRNLG